MVIHLYRMNTRKFLCVTAELSPSCRDMEHTALKVVECVLKF